MTWYNSSMTPIVISITFSLPLALSNGMGESAIAGSKQTKPHQTTASNFLVSLEFQPPEEAAPRSATGGAVRGQVEFEPPGDKAPRTATGGATRGDGTFLPPGETAPRTATGGATRGDVIFLPPGETAPSNATHGGSRTGNVDFQPPEDPAPSNAIGGSTRDDNTTKSYGESIREVIPLIPGSNHGRTVSSHPTIYVYIPKTDTREVFFSLQDENRNHHYQTTLEISGQGGIVSVTLPKHLPGLEIGKNYVWFFAPIARGDILQPDNYGVTGWVKRVKPIVPLEKPSSSAPLEIATLYAGQGIWYDTLKILASAKLTQPSNSMLVTEWQDLLENVGLEAIAVQPISEQL